MREESGERGEAERPTSGTELELDLPLAPERELVPFEVTRDRLGVAHCWMHRGEKGQMDMKWT